MLPSDVLDRPEAEEFEDDAEQALPEESDRLEQFAQAQGDISHFLTADELVSLGAQCVEDWNADKGSIQAWRDMAEAALKQAAQDKGDIKTWPWANASNVQYPLLTTAAQQFAARAYPAIVKGDVAVGIKVMGVAPEKPDVPANLPPPEQMPPEMQQQLQAVAQGFEQAQTAWQNKNARAERVKTWMNYHLFYGMIDWEGGVDTLLNQLPIIGMAFKKVYFDPHRGVCSDYVNALHLVVHKDTESLERCPRVTQDFQLYPYEIKARMAAGTYRDVEYVTFQTEEDEQQAREVIEQHRLHDLDEDGIPEPYIVTVDVESSQVLKVEAAFGPEDIARSKEDDQIVHIKRWMPFIAFPFMPDPEGSFYGLGFGQLLQPMTAVINTAINQLTDAATAQAAGGGFIGSGLRLQGAGQTPSLKWQPGQYLQVNMAGGAIKDAIWERTLPQVSPVLFQLLELMLGAAKEVASIKDVLMGNTPATAPVGTTMALIEQGLQSFSALYKRVYRAMKDEFRAIYQCQGKWGSPEEYAEILDDPQADFEADFSPKGHDIVPVSDPSVVTRSQALAKAQVIQQVAQAFPNVMDPREAIKRILEAADIDNPDELLPAPPKEPPPQMVAEIDKTKSETELNLAKAEQAKAGGLKDVAEARVKTGAAQAEGAESAAFTLGTAHAGGVSSVEGTPDQPMGLPGPQDGGGNPEAGLAGQVMGEPDGGSPAAEGASIEG